MLKSTKTAKIGKINIISENEVDVFLNYFDTFKDKDLYSFKIIQIENEEELKNIVDNFNKNITNNDLVKNKAKLSYTEYDISAKDLKDNKFLKFKTSKRIKDLDFLAYIFLVYADSKNLSQKLKIKDTSKLEKLQKIIEFNYEIVKKEQSLVHRKTVESLKLFKKSEIKDFFSRDGFNTNLSIISEIFTSYKTNKDVVNYFYVYPQNVIQQYAFYPDFFSKNYENLIADVHVYTENGTKIQCKYTYINNSYICTFEDRIENDKNYKIAITFKDLSVSFFETTRPEIINYITILNNIVSLSNDDRFYNFDKQEFNNNLIKSSISTIYDIINRIIYVNNVVSKDELKIIDFAYMTDKSISYDDIYLLVERAKSLLYLIDQIYLNYNLKTINIIYVDTKVKHNTSEMMFETSLFEKDVYKINRVILDKNYENIQLENYGNINKLYLKNIKKISYKDAFFEFGYNDLRTGPKLSNYINLSNLSSRTENLSYRRLANNNDETYLKLYFNKVFEKSLKEKNLVADEYSLIYILNNIEYRLLYWDTITLEWKKVVSTLGNNTLYKLEELNKPEYIDSKIVNEYFLV
jgi:hypothetical protein